MAKNPGDRCPQCREGLLEKDKTGLACSKCDYHLTLSEVVAANKRSETEVDNGDGKPYMFKPKTFKISIDTPEEGEEFLRGLILARQNNNSEFFPMLIDAVNAILEPWRKARLDAQIAARG